MNNTYPQKVVIIDLTHTEKQEFRKEKAPGNWPLAPFSFEVFKKSPQEKQRIKECKAAEKAFSTNK